MRILVVEDDSLLAQGLTRILSRAGHAVDQAENGLQADKALRTPVARFLEQERAAMTEEMEWLEEEYSPFRHADPPPGD